MLPHVSQKPTASVVHEAALNTVRIVQNHRLIYAAAINTYYFHCQESDDRQK